MLSAWIVTAVLSVWWLIEISCLRRRSTAPSRSWDKGSSRAWDVAHGIQLAGMFVGFLGIGGIDGARAGVQVSGLGLVLAGITVRWTAIYTLGKLFTGRVQIQEGHTLVRSGLYSRLRHPAYAGSLILHLGIGLAFANWWTLASSVLPYLAAVIYRIHVEETALEAAFGPAYEEYARTTKRLVPWVY